MVSDLPMPMGSEYLANKFHVSLYCMGSVKKSLLSSSYIVMIAQHTSGLQYYYNQPREVNPANRDPEQKAR